MGNLCGKEPFPSVYLNRGDLKHALVDQLPVEQGSGTCAPTSYSPEVNNQLQSAFLSRLSLDVRMLIYQEVLEIGGALHIELQIGKLVYIKCLRPEGAYDANTSPPDSWGRYHRACKASVLNAIITRTRKNPFSPLLMTCRQVYVRSFNLFTLHCSASEG
jgi:hypothetical protein